MGTINWTKVMIGGIVAGIIINVLEWVLHGLILGPQWREAMQALGHPMHETGNRIAFYFVLGLAYGIMAVWLYASMRPRFGAGPKTALYASLAVWVLGYLLPNFSWLPRGLFPRHLLAIAVVVGAIEVLVATEAGAWLYQELGPTAERATRAA